MFEEGFRRRGLLVSLRSLGDRWGFDSFLAQSAWGFDSFLAQPAWGFDSFLAQPASARRA
ncbi:hypothetical protein GCM10028815_33490 [Mariniluteicoccus flavus]